MFHCVAICQQKPIEFEKKKKKNIEKNGNLLSNLSLNGVAEVFSLVMTLSKANGNALKNLNAFRYFYLFRFVAVFFSFLFTKYTKGIETSRKDSYKLYYSAIRRVVSFIWKYQRMPNSFFWNIAYENPLKWSKWWESVFFFSLECIAIVGI